jgi:hypothetical protein
VRAQFEVEDARPKPTEQDLANTFTPEQIKVLDITACGNSIDFGGSTYSLVTGDGKTVRTEVAGYKSSVVNQNGNTVLIFSIQGKHLKGAVNALIQCVNRNFDTEKAIGYLIEAFGAKKYETNVLKRGLDFPPKVYPRVMLMH